MILDTEIRSTPARAAGALVLPTRCEPALRPTLVFAVLELARLDSLWLLGMGTPLLTGAWGRRRVLELLSTYRIRRHMTLTEAS